MVTTQQDVRASPSIPHAVDQSLDKGPLRTIVFGELEPVVADLVKKVLSHPTTWPGGLPTTPVCSFGPSTPPLDVDELRKQLVDTAETRGRSADDCPSPRINEPREVRFKKVLETWDKDISKYKIVESIEPEVDDEFSEYAFVVREHIDPKSKDSTTYVDVKSETLRDIVREVLGNVKAVSVMEPKPSIEQIVLFHFLPELKSHPEGVEHLRLLIDHIDKTYAAKVERLASLLQRGEITYDLLELLFKPGCHVYTKCFGTGKSRCVVFDAAEETTRKDVTHLKLECHYLDHDDHEFGEVGIELGIVKFRGRKPIRTLEAFPLQYHPDSEQIARDLIERGRKFAQFIGRSSTAILQHCRGTAFIMKNGKPLALNIDSRVAIDAALFREMMPNYRRPRVSDCWEDLSIIRGISLKEEERREELEKFKANGKDQHSITEDECLICCPTVRCFSFTDKIFAECAVGDLADVQWYPASFDRLQIPNDTKEILLSVTTARLSGNNDAVFDDFIKGKGRGLNVLFYGVPGVGKTFTVEATAERFQAPLYSVSAGELIADHGDPLQLDMTLDRIFKIAKRLNTVLLVDEADVFMEKRASYQGSHNRLVTVFLRKLEYYEGVLFLTTNRVMEFDEAVLSRIHLKIKYPELTQNARRNIWESFLSGARTLQGPAAVDPSELEHLASMKLNGREASHNTSSLRLSLAFVENAQVTFKHLVKATKANDKFVEEFKNSGRMQGMYT
ncbi:P-loop containing nucleoside triphosphate hydrolase protein [Aspergillus keveii]|uniref:P-loop containing nucleoside triphosphate hydrolase protein n=1 Tax=Aspergillus keveii TaxID=714993 RepID=A0ABR4FLR6_9EURO